MYAPRLLLMSYLNICATISYMITVIRLLCSVPDLGTVSGDLLDTF